MYSGFMLSIYQYLYMFLLLFLPYALHPKNSGGRTAFPPANASKFSSLM